MKNLFFTYRRELLVLTLIPLIISLNLFRNNYVFGGAEEGLPFFNLRNTISLYSNIWVDQVPGFPLVFESGKIPFLYIMYLFSLVVGSGSFLSSMYIFLLMTTGIISMFFFTVIILPESQNRKHIAFWASVFYLLNPFSMSQIWGRHLSMQMHPFAFFPGFMALFIYGLNKKKFSCSIIAIVFSIIFSGTFNHPSYVFTLLFIVCLYILLKLFSAKNERLYILWFSLKTGILFLIANAFWILPYYSALKESNYFIGDGENLSILVGLSKYFPLTTVLTLKQKFYFDEAQTFGDVYLSLLFRMLALLLPFFLVIGIIKIRKLRFPERKFIVFGFIISLVISVGVNRPLGGLVLWLINNFSILEVFRNTYEKFGLVLSIFYSLLFGLGFHEFFSIFIKNANVFKSLFVIIIFGLYIFPMWTGKAFQGENSTNEPPLYYTNFINWIESTNDNGRILFTPLLNGDATHQIWNGKNYNGIDINPFILTKSTITRSIPGVLGNDFSHELRKQMQQRDVSELLKALRVNYIVNRNDLVANSHLKKHIDFLTDKTTTLSENVYPVCRIEPKQKLTLNVFYQCKLENQDLTNTAFIHLGIESNKKAAIEVRLLDSNGFRSRWDGKSEKDYLIDENTKTLILPIGIETELPEKFLYKNVVAIEISFSPIKDNANPEVILSSVKLDSGKNIKLNKFKKINTFGELDVFSTGEPVYEEIRVPNEIVVVNSYTDLFKDYKALKNRTYLIKQPGIEHEVRYKNSLSLGTRHSSVLYTLELNDDSEALIWFAKSFNPSWKIIPKKTTNDLDIISSSFVEETKHFTADGYANLWKVSGSKAYTIVYAPALYFRLGAKATIITAIVIILYLALKTTQSRKNKTQ